MIKIEKEKYNQALRAIRLCKDDPASITLINENYYNPINAGYRCVDDISDPDYILFTTPKLMHY